MKKTINLNIFFSLLFLLFLVGTPQITNAQSTANQEQMDQLKKDYQEGKITLEQYQQKTNALLNASVTQVMTTTPGDHFQKGGRCFIAGGIFTLLGAGAMTTGFLVNTGSSSGQYALIGGGGGLAFLGVILNIAGGSQMVKGGKKLNSLRIGQTATLEINPIYNGVGLALQF